MGSVRVRYIVDDVDAAMAFYTDHLGFEVAMRPAPGFAMLTRGDLQLLLNAPGAGGAGRGDVDFAALLELEADLAGMDLVAEDVDVSDGLTPPDGGEIG